MGLDMYLARKQHFGGYDEKIQQVRLVPQNGDKEKVIELSQPGRVAIKVNIAYWRKANAVHRWFVENCADGEDDGKPVDVGITQLRELKELCEKVMRVAKLERRPAEDGSGIKERQIITNADVIAKLLPTQDGFFFGSTEYDEWYLQDIEDTIKQLGEIISEHEKLVASGVEEYNIDYVYEASW